MYACSFVFYPSGADLMHLLKANNYSKGLVFNLIMMDTELSLIRHRLITKKKKKKP